jgi:spore coat protein H
MGRWAWVLVAVMAGLVACAPDDVPPTPPPYVDPGEELRPEPANDAGVPDAGTDAGSRDAGRPDAGEPDAGRPDAGRPDAGRPDAGTDAGTRPEPRPGDFPPVQTRVPTFHLFIAPEALAKLEAHPTSDEMVPVEVELDGERVKGQIRYRGASTRELEQKSYKLELDKGYELEDRDHFHLLAAWFDGGKLTDKFASDLYTALGLPVPRARYVTVTLNGEHQGLYVEMEHVGKDYVKHHGMERGASVYRGGHRNGELTLTPGTYQTDFEKKTNEGTGRADLDLFLARVNRSDDADLEAWLEAHLDLEAYLGNLAADALISNNVIEDSRSYWIHELQRDVWTYVPWDLNNAQLLYWRTWNENDPPITRRWPQAFTLYDPWVQRIWETRVAQRPSQRPTWSVLATRVWDRPALRARLLAKLEAALAGPFSEAKAHAHIDALWAVAGPELARDPKASPPHVARAVGFLKRYVRERRLYLQETLQKLKAHGSGPLVIRELATGSTGYVELYNRGSTPLSLGDYTLTQDLRSPGRYTLPAELVLPPGTALRLVADGNPAAGPEHLPFTLSPEGGEVGVFDARRRSDKGQPLVYGPEDAVYYGPLPEGTAYGRTTPDSEDFLRRPLVP